MPATSVDTFFACSLMVILVLSAMASTSKLLYPHINNAVDVNAGERYREIADYLLLNDGYPSDWGQNSQTIPEVFGLAKTGEHNPYELDIDKVSRLNSENLYAIDYAQLFSALEMSDVSLKLQIQPIFEVSINLTATFEAQNETVYQFEISTRKHGTPIPTELRCYTIAEDYSEVKDVTASNGIAYVNITISNDVKGPVLFVTFAKAIYNTKIMSFGVYAFAHGAAEPKLNGTFLKLSPLNYTLNASAKYSGMNVSTAYALSFDYNSTLTQISKVNQSVMYSIPHFLDPSPTILAVSGWNSTEFFTDWTVYPQIPLEMGADFADSTALSNIYVNTYIVTIDSTLYECTIWIGGPRQ